MNNNIPITVVAKLKRSREKDYYITLFKRRRRVTNREVAWFCSTLSEVFHSFIPDEIEELEIKLKSCSIYLTYGPKIPWYT